MLTGHPCDLAPTLFEVPSNGFRLQTREDEEKQVVGIDAAAHGCGYFRTTANKRKIR